jgi:urease gamma subunit
VRGRFFLDAGREFRLKFATQTKAGVIPNTDLIAHMTARIPEQRIGAVFIDPFVGAHEVNENDNMAVNEVVSLIRAVADSCKCAFGIVHHIRKGNGEDANIDSVRGAGSLIGAARAARVINRVTEDDATRLCVTPEDARGLFRVDDGKANLAPPADAATYRRMVGVQIANGEWVGVATAFTMPDAFDGVTVRDLIDVQQEVHRRCEQGIPPRFSDQAGPEWVGFLIADMLRLDGTEDRPKVKKILAAWMKSGALVKGEFVDETRRKRPIVEVGQWASE